MEFAYTENNPISRKDLDGTLWFQIIGMGIGGFVSATINGIANCTEGKSFLDGAIGSFASGAVSRLVATTVGNLGGFASGAVITGTSFIEATINETVAANNENRTISYKNIAKDTAVSSVTSIATSNVQVYGINNGWFKPKKLSTSIFGNYQKKITVNTVVSGIAAATVVPVANGIVSVARTIKNKASSALKSFIGIFSSGKGSGGGWSAGVLSSKGGGRGF